MQNKSGNRKRTPETVTAIVLAALLVGGFWLVVGGYPSLVMKTHEQTSISAQLPPADPNNRTYDPALPLDHVTYQKYRLVPRGDLQQLPKTQMVYLGRATEGYSLWTQAPKGEAPLYHGGGGGKQAPRAVPQSLGKVYLRTNDDRYQQVVQP